MNITRHINDIYRHQSRKVHATLIRLLGDFDLAEEALQEAFTAALRQWPEQGIPDNPAAWLIKTGHRRGIDHIRRRQTASHKLVHLADEESPVSEEYTDTIDDDLLRLIFTCCHPGLATEAQLALTLREICGLTTEQVASALLQKPATTAQRIVRAKRKIREAGIPYEVPEQRELPERLQSVLKVVYLIFNEGYSATDGNAVVNVSLANEAIRLARLLAELLPEGEVFGLLALMLLHDSRRNARQDANGELITLEDQNRDLWDRNQIRSGLTWLSYALPLTPTGPYTLQASIAAAHAEAATPEDTDWSRIARLYETLYQQLPSPVIALNRAVAVAMRDTPEEGLKLLDQLAGQKAIQNYYLFHAARADLYRRSGDMSSARTAYQRALSLTQQGPEQRFLNRRLMQLDSGH
ncbi:RNA polymerase sigma factor [Marinobacter sp. HL-58]|uniref:RNA polymerase sigma factor n=1 Tax=Marinobacter sp. HL-58 TaxID=1479237 RepID=UPI0004887B3B|nr:RNA polymerase sigma factor [Marinobacter sp. HL-58]KPP97984.1 MAG: RNA polymerase sigma-70 factor, ECF subfamily [Marinobacter sp. HL-58]